jgi:tRNA (mo5U34)-methyltransferase
MDKAAIQARIDAVSWYHEFDFGNGLKSKSKIRAADGHRDLWKFMEEQLDAIDFRGKSVLDIGCWDGYWSFYAERRGAARVLATDDRTQNWSDGSGVLLAKELLGSSVEVNQGVSIYDLASLNQKFDVILCLGVYYHLYDPLYAFTQVRHCCHPNTVVAIDGVLGTTLQPSTALYQFAHHGCEWLPTAEALEQLLQATYFSVDHKATLGAGRAAPAPLTPAKPPHLGWRWRLRMCAQALSGSFAGVKGLCHQVEAPPAPAPSIHTMPSSKDNQRVFLKCVPREGANEIYCYRPPFGLREYDARFRDGGARGAA